MASPLKDRYTPHGLESRSLSREKKRARKKWKRRHEEDRSPQPKIKYKTTYRVKARDQARGRLIFFKTRTKLPVTTIKRLLARGGATEERIPI